MSALLAFEWSRLTSGQAVIMGAVIALLATSAQALASGRWESRRASQAFELERLRIGAATEAEERRMVASREVEERRIDAAAEADTRRWVRDELRAELAGAVAAVDAAERAWARAARSQAWVRSRGGSPADARLGFDNAAVDAYDAAVESTRIATEALAGLGLLGSWRLVEGADGLTEAFDAYGAALATDRTELVTDAELADIELRVRLWRWRLLDEGRLVFGLGSLRPVSDPF